MAKYKNNMFDCRMKYYDSVFKTGTIKYLDQNNIRSLAYYKFENNLFDSSGNGYDASLIYSSPTLSYAPGIIGECAVFSYTHAAIYVPSLSNYFEAINAYSIVIWFKTTQTTNGTLFATTQIGTGGTELWLAVNNNHVEWHRYIDSARAVGTLNSYSDDSWHLAVAQFTGAQLILNIDGGTEIITTDDARSAHGSSKVVFGEDGATSRKYTGSMDEIQIIDRSLSNNEILSIYNNSFGSKNGNIKYYDSSWK